MHVMCMRCGAYLDDVVLICMQCGGIINVQVSTHLTNRYTLSLFLFLTDRHIAAQNLTVAIISACLFVLSFFPRGVSDEILNLIESVSEDFPSYSCISELLCLCCVEIFKKSPRTFI